MRRSANVAQCYGIDIRTLAQKLFFHYHCSCVFSCKGPALCAHDNTTSGILVVLLLHISLVPDFPQATTPAVRVITCARTAFVCLRHDTIRATAAPTTATRCTSTWRPGSQYMYMGSSKSSDSIHPSCLPCSAHYSCTPHLQLKHVEHGHVRNASSRCGP